MLENIIERDRELFLYLNSKHLEWLDPIMLVLSSYILWGIVFGLFGLLVFVKSKKYKLAPVLFYAGGVTFCAIFTNLLKLVIKRPRPIHVGEWKGLIHDIEEYSAAFSFYSSHAATTFCIAVFVSSFFKSNKVYGCIALIWASGVSYSRIYVAKHYPLDVFTGAMFGIIVGYLSYLFLTRYIVKKEGLSI